MTSFIYRMHITASCFRIGKVRRKAHARPETCQKNKCKNFDATLYHSLTFGCSLTVIKAQVDSMRYILKAWTLFKPSLTYVQNYGTNKVMLLRFLTRVDKRS